MGTNTDIVVYFGRSPYRGDCQVRDGHAPGEQPILSKNDLYLMRQGEFRQMLIPVPDDGYQSCTIPQPALRVSDSHLGFTVVRSVDDPSDVWVVDLNELSLAGEGYEKQSLSVPYETVEGLFDGPMNLDTSF